MVHSWRRLLKSAVAQLDVAQHRVLERLTCTMTTLQLLVGRCVHYRAEHGLALRYTQHGVVQTILLSEG